MNFQSPRKKREHSTTSSPSGPSSNGGLLARTGTPKMEEIMLTSATPDIFDAKRMRFEDDQDF